MFRLLTNYLFLILAAVLLIACGDSDAPEEKVAAAEETAVQLPTEVIEEITMALVEVIEDETEEMKAEVDEAMTAVEASAEPVANANPQTHSINAEARIFKPDTVYINPGDTVGWRNMASHNTISVEGMIPEGATPWAGKLGQNLKVTLDVEGIYAYVC